MPRRSEKRCAAQRCITRQAMLASPRGRFVEIKSEDQQAVLAIHRSRDLVVRMPGIGPITASAIVATIGDAHQFRTGRDLAAWLGLTPLNKSSGGQRTPLADHQEGRPIYSKAVDPWDDVTRVDGAGQTRKVRHLDRKNARGEAVPAMATVAMANKSARIIWAMRTKRKEYRQPIV